MIGHPDRFVDDFLAPGERVIFRSPPEMLAWALVQLVDYAVAALLLLIVFTADSTAIQLGALAALVVVVVQYTWRALNIWYTRYVLTNYRALRVSGVLRTDCEWMAWSKVTDVEINRSIPDYLFQTATIRIRNANEASNFKEMADVPRPLEFAETITRMVQARQGPVRWED